MHLWYAATELARTISALLAERPVLRITASVFSVALLSVAAWAASTTWISGATPSASAVGTVTLQGQPLARGSILFVPMDPAKGNITGTLVSGGRFSLPRGKGLVPGTYRVEIRSPKQSSEMVPKPFSDPGDMIAATTEGVAAEHNEASSLRTTITAGRNRLSYDVSPR